MLFRFRIVITAFEVLHIRDPYWLVVILCLEFPVIPNWYSWTNFFCRWTPFSYSKTWRSGICTWRACPLDNSPRRCFCSAFASKFETRYYNRRASWRSSSSSCSSSIPLWTCHFKVRRLISLNFCFRENWDEKTICFRLICLFWALAKFGEFVAVKLCHLCASFALHDLKSTTLHMKLYGPIKSWNSFCFILSVIYNTQSANNCNITC